MILKVGLTGGIASGKSTITSMLGDLGCITVDADTVVAELYRRGGAGHEAIVRNYGAGILTAAGEIDRAALADIAFSSQAEAHKLNALIHPLVIEEESRRMADEERRRANSDVIAVIEATLLLESGGRQRYDRIVVVDVDPATQLARAFARGMSREEATRRMAHQMPRNERLAHADYVIDNSGDRATAKAGVAKLYEKLRADLEAKKRGNLMPRR